MTVKFFYPDAYGKIVFTKEELEKLLNDVYDEGRRDGFAYYTPITPNTITTTPLPVYYNSTGGASTDSCTIYCTNDNSIGRTYLETYKGE